MQFVCRHNRPQGQCRCWEPEHTWFDRMIRLAFGAAVTMALIGSFAVRGHAAEIRVTTQPCFISSVKHHKKHATPIQTCEAPKPVPPCIQTPPDIPEAVATPHNIYIILPPIDSPPIQADNPPDSPQGGFWGGGEGWFDGGGSPTAGRFPGGRGTLAPEIDGNGSMPALTLLAGIVGMIAAIHKQK